MKGDAGATCVLHGERGRIVAAGGGRRDQLDADSIRDAAAGVARLGLGGTVAWLLDESLGLSAGRAGARGRRRPRPRRLRPGAWKTDGPERRLTNAWSWSGQTTRRYSWRNARERVAQWANRARDLANRPPNDLTPERLADRAAEIAQGSTPLSYESFDRGQIEAMGMGAFAAVAQGSHNEPRLIVLRYDPPGARDDLVLGLVGKAITFDTGGISLKPARLHGGHEGRHVRRRGGDRGHRRDRRAGPPAPRARRRRRRPRTCQGGGAFRPGDILTAMNGKTIEVINTDAEGRLVLADALWLRARAGRDAPGRHGDADRRDGARDGRPLRGRVRERRRAGATRSSTRRTRPATTSGRCRCTAATAAT